VKNLYVNFPAATTDDNLPVAEKPPKLGLDRLTCY